LYLLLNFTCLYLAAQCLPAGIGETGPLRITDPEQDAAGSWRSVQFPTLLFGLTGGLVYALAPQASGTTFTWNGFMAAVIIGATVRVSVAVFSASRIAIREVKPTLYVLAGALCASFDGAGGNCNRLDIAAHGPESYAPVAFIAGGGPCGHGRKPTLGPDHTPDAVRVTPLDGKRDIAARTRGDDGKRTGWRGGQGVCLRGAAGKRGFALRRQCAAVLFFQHRETDFDAAFIRSTFRTEGKK
jgi:hypothetical protein